MATVKILSLVLAFFWLGYLGAYAGDNLAKWTSDKPVPVIIQTVETREA